MPRLVIPDTVAEGRFAAAESVRDVPPDKYGDRLVKYIPAESVAFYTFVDKLLTSYYGIDASGTATARSADRWLTYLPWAFLILGLVGTPIYLYRQRLKDQPWGVHAMISTLAFVLWAYTLGGSVFILHHWYHILIAGVAAPAFTFIAGWFEPQSI
jgi:hypothetical protein